MLKVDSRIRVRYKETDQMGVVHHSNYYTWFEVGRTEYMRAKGMTYRAMEERGWMLPLIETYCVYKQGARYDDIVIIRTWMAEYKGARITMEYEVIRDKDHILLAKGHTVHAITDVELKPVNLRKADPKMYEFFMGCLH
jgi:acyl-CoA thioester hydrolase